MSGGRFEALDGLRGVAALIVALAHYAQYAPVPGFPSSYFAVDVFFCLSGFVLGHAYFAQLEDGVGWRTFAVRRLARLYPAYVLGSGIGVVALSLKRLSDETEFSGTGVAVAAAVSLFFLPYPNHLSTTTAEHAVRGALFPVNDPAWSLFFELIVNAAFFAIAAHAGRRWVARVIILAIPALLVVVWTGHVEDGWGSSRTHLVAGLIRSFAYFFVGVWLSGIKPSVRPAIAAGWAAPLLLLLVAIASLPITLVSSVAAMIAVPALVHLGSSVTASPFWRRLFSELGEISYPLYCLHIPLLMLADVLGGLTMLGGGWLEPAMLLTATLLISRLVARFWERPWRARLTLAFAR